MSTTTRQMGAEARRAVSRDWLDPAARAGLLAKAALYGIIGALALAVALGEGGETTDQKGALATLTDEPAGKVLIGLLAVGLLAYGVWRLVQAIFDTGGEGEDATGVVTRIGYAASGAIHLALFAFAIRLLAGSGGSASGAGSGSGSGSGSGVGSGVGSGSGSGSGAVSVVSGSGSGAAVAAASGPVPSPSAKARLAAGPAVTPMATVRKASE
jgi:Domain of Unknown Function (DUF1206)